MSSTTTTATAGEALGAAIDALAAAGVDSPRLDAELLLAAATGWERSRFVSGPDASLPPGTGRKFAAMVRRRVRREPIAYILGRKGFRRIELAVDRRVLIPRPETELLVEVAVGTAPSRVADVGTGSGAVALAVADELPEASVVATDTSDAALELARANAGRLGLAGRVRFEPGSAPDGEFDLLLANLPYVSGDEWQQLTPEIRRFEPRHALVAGPTGLESIESLLAQVASHPRPPARIALEVGEGQAETVGRLIAAAGYSAVEPHPDLAGVDRILVGSR